MSEEKPAESQPTEENKDKKPKKDQKRGGKGFGKGKEEEEALEFQKKKNGSPLLI